jgi:hypothetical protein
VRIRNRINPPKSRSVQNRCQEDFLRIQFDEVSSAMTRKFPEMVLLPIGSRSDQENPNDEFWIACYEFVARIQIRILAIAAVDKAPGPQGTREN